MRREEGTGAMPLWGAGSEVEFRLRFVQNVSEDSECKPPSLIFPSASQHWWPEGRGEGRAGGVRQDRWARARLHPTCPEDKGRIRSQLC